MVSDFVSCTGSARTESEEKAILEVLVVLVVLVFVGLAGLLGLVVLCGIMSLLA